MLCARLGFNILIKTNTDRGRAMGPLQRTKPKGAPWKTQRIHKILRKPEKCLCFCSEEKVTPFPLTVHDFEMRICM